MKDRPGTGFYCEDCNRIMDSAAYAEHNADHMMRPIIWDFLTSQNVIRNRLDHVHRDKEWKVGEDAVCKTCGRKFVWNVKDGLAGWIPQ